MVKKLIVLSLLSLSLGVTCSTFADEKSDVTTEITTITKEMERVSGSISSTLAKISEIDSTLKSNQEKVIKIKETLNKQARDIQTANDKYNIWNLILRSRSFSEFFALLNSEKLITGANDQKVTELNNLLKENESKKALLNKDISDLQMQQKQLQEKNNELHAKLETIKNKEEKEKLQQQTKANDENLKSVQSVVTSIITTGQLPEQNTGSKQFGVNQAREAFEQITQDYGISASEKAIWAQVITAESGWNTTVWNSGGSGAYGLGQALPASKMAVYGSDYMTNPYTQLVWMYNYVKDRYGSFAGINWASRGWY